MSDAAYHAGQWAKEKVLSATASTGFTVEDLLVEGRVYTDSDAILAIANIQKGDPLFAFDTAGAKNMLEKLSWVKSARVTRKLPNAIHIELEERQPLALWQQNKKLTLVDTEGAFLTDRDLKRFKDLIIVVGDQAPQNAGALLELLNAEPSIYSKIESATFISERRWDIVLKNGVKVKLPEDGIAFALSRLAKAQEEENLLDKDIKAIDMREVERIVIKTKPGAVQEYKASFLTNSNSGDAI